MNWQMYTNDVLTDSDGIANISYHTNNIVRDLDYGEITNCLGVAKITYKNIEYWSNPVRYNFSERNEITIIEAGTCIEPGLLNRTNYDIIDSDNRDNIIYERPNQII